MKKLNTVRDEINKMFPSVNEKYPVASVVDGKLLVSGETSVKVKEHGEIFEGMLIDYYGEFRGGYTWVDSKLEKYLDKIGYSYEWIHAGCIIVFAQNKVKEN